MKSVTKMSVSPLKLYNFKYLHSVLIGTKQKLIQHFQLTCNWISSLEFLTLPHHKKANLAKLQHKCYVQSISKKIRVQKANVKLTWHVWT